MCGVPMRHTPPFQTHLQLLDERPAEANTSAEHPSTFPAEGLRQRTVEERETLGLGSPVEASHGMEHPYPGSKERLPTTTGEGRASLRSKSQQEMGCPDKIEWMALESKLQLLTAQRQHSALRCQHFLQSLEQELQAEGGRLGALGGMGSRKLEDPSELAVGPSELAMRRSCSESALGSCKHLSSRASRKLLSARGAEPCMLKNSVPHTQLDHTFSRLEFGSSDDELPKAKPSALSARPDFMLLEHTSPESALSRCTKQRPEGHPSAALSGGSHFSASSSCQQQRHRAPRRPSSTHSMRSLGALHGQTSSSFSTRRQNATSGKQRRSLKAFQSLDMPYGGDRAASDIGSVPCFPSSDNCGAGHHDGGAQAVEAYGCLASSHAFGAIDCCTTEGTARRIASELPEAFIAIY